MNISAPGPSPLTPGRVSPAKQGQTSDPRPDQAELSGTEKEGEKKESQRADETKKAADNERTLQKLEKRDLETRSHERAHIAAGGRYVRGAASYTYQTGPDGRRYAVGGEVSIDLSNESTPEATVQKMNVVRAAALAPANPSSQDQAVAAKAASIAAQARGEMAEEGREKAKEALGNGEERKGLEEARSQLGAGQAKAAVAIYSAMQELQDQHKPGDLVSGATSVKA